MPGYTDITDKIFSYIIRYIFMLYQRATVLLVILLIGGFLFANGLTYAESNQKTIEWGNESLDIFVIAGTVKEAVSKFRAHDFDEINIWVTPSLQQYITIVSPMTFPVESGKDYQVEMLISIPIGTPHEKIAGTIHIRGADNTIPEVLHVSLLVGELELIDVSEPIVSWPTLDRVSVEEETGRLVVEDEIWITFSTYTSDDNIKTIIDSIGGVIVGVVPRTNTYQVRIQATEETEYLETILSQLEEIEEVVYTIQAWFDEAQAENYGDHGQIPSDEYPSNSWNEEKPAGNNSSFEHIELPSAWGITTGDDTLKIGVVEPAFFDHRHIDLLDNVPNPPSKESPEVFVKHGTSVAGIIGAQGDNNIGVTGVMWDASLELYPGLGSILLTWFEKFRTPDFNTPIVDD
jgi:hypothetical protein